MVHSFATGGLENGVVNIINALPENEYRHTIVCVTNHDPEFFARIKQNNTQVINLNKPSGNSPKWLYHCWKLLRELKPDICHTRNLSAIEAQLPAFLAGVPYRIHGEHGWDVSDIGGTNKKYQFLRKLYKPLIHQYVALSKEAQDYLTHAIKAKASKVRRICNGVDIDKFVPNHNRTLLPDGFANEDTVIFGTVGRLAQVKNQTFLVESFLDIWQQNPVLRDKIKLVIIGDGILLPKLQEMVSECGANASVWFAGRKDNVPQLMQQLDVFVLPSLAEGISNTLLEAMASGIPYIATDVGGNADLILPKHLDTHIVEVNNNLQLKSAMLAYIKTPENIKKDSELVRKHCEENFSLAGMVASYHQLYQFENK